MSARRPSVAARLALRAVPARDLRKPRDIVNFMNFASAPILFAGPEARA